MLKYNVTFNPTKSLNILTSPWHIISQFWKIQDFPDEEDKTINVGFWNGNNFFFAMHAMHSRDIINIIFKVWKQFNVRNVRTII